MKAVVIIPILVILMLVMLYLAVTRKKDQEDASRTEKTVIQDEFHGKGIIGKMNRNPLVAKVGSIGKTPKLEKLFKAAKNPWRMSYTTFTFIRIAGVVAGVVVAAILYQVEPLASLLGVLVAALGFIYPMYYYQSVARERADQWMKLYQFIWVLSNNATLYDAQKVFLNTSLYIEDHYPQYTELITGFNDFYKYWDPELIPDYIRDHYFQIPIAKEAYRMMFTMNQTGVYPEDQLAQFRSFIVNQQNARVEQVLSNVASKATIASLPFLMISIVIALLVPMLMTFLTLM